MTDPRNPFEGQAERNQESRARSQPETFTDEDRAELMALREERAQRRAEVEARAKAEKEAEPEPTHWLHLADGRIIESSGQMTHYKGIQVVGSYPITKEEVTA